MRCRRTAGATAIRSSTPTHARPDSSAFARPASRSACIARGLAPKRTNFFTRAGAEPYSGWVAIVIFAATSATCGATTIWRTMRWMNRSMLRSSTRCALATAVPVVDTPIERSTSIVGNPTTTFMRKRSSCASGSGYVPSVSIGFCVAITQNGSGSV